MTDRKKVITTLEQCLKCECDNCNVNGHSGYPWNCPAYDQAIVDALELLKELDKRIEDYRVTDYYEFEEEEDE